MNIWEVEIRVLKETIRDLGDWIVPAAKEKLGSLQVSLHTNKEICNTLMETGECNDFPGFIENMRSFRKDYHEQIRAVQNYVKQARSFKTGYTRGV